jgi:hypothetical protein
VHGLGRPGEAAVVSDRNDKLDMSRVHALMLSITPVRSSSLTHGPSGGGREADQAGTRAESRRRR